MTSLAFAPVSSAPQSGRNRIDPPPRAVVIGYGMAGRDRARTLARDGYSLAIICPEAELQARAAADHASARIAGSLEELDYGGYFWPDCVAAIAVPAVSACHTFHQLAWYGVRRVVLEETTVLSSRETAGISERAEREGITVVTEARRC